ncbi:glycosyltransferase family 2 protein [Dolichospermum planctonicum]|uniref:Glycosyl transferase family protein n=1 Tax=Dolichospermum planctonicum TaxID=136072 RepID=A0A480AJ33_9CYAN|nr:glycosyltransferase [Dolichospermum planctonicum]GCL44096.1 glycosyl transferase family protein [Dolichospermum planctonicum]
MNKHSVKIHVVTYRRPHLLVRALKSLINQTYQGWIAEVINDDPLDDKVIELINSLNDPRIFLSSPSIHRGGTENFNYAFRSSATTYACLLEDDNWYEENFLEYMIFAMNKFPHIDIACANEKIWKEQKEGDWIDTGVTIWQNDDEFDLFKYDILDKCGSAKICNSSMFWKTKNSSKWQTPKSIPIDVTEHFRERVIPHPILLVHKPLVNYAETINSYRYTVNSKWGSYQALLIGSAFVLAPISERNQLANSLWKRALTTQKYLYTSLLFTGMLFPEAILLWRYAPLNLKLRFILTLIRRPISSLLVLQAKKKEEEAYNFLIFNKS